MAKETKEVKDLKEKTIERKAQTVKQLEELVKSRDKEEADLKVYVEEANKHLAAKQQDVAGTQPHGLGDGGDREEGRETPYDETQDEGSSAHVHHLPTGHGRRSRPISAGPTISTCRTRCCAARGSSPGNRAPPCS